MTKNRVLAIVLLATTSGLFAESANSRLHVERLGVERLGVEPLGVERIHFGRGGAPVTIRRSVLRGERDTYRFRARARQKLGVSITALEKNAAFELLGPGKKPLPGAGETDDATRWSGTLPANGDYSIVVGSRRGNAT